MRGLRSRWFLALAAVFACPGVALSCSVGLNYRIPSSLELADRADTIVLGVVEAQANSVDSPDPMLLVRPVTLLKGEALPKQILLPGEMDNGQYPATHSDPRELQNPHPGVWDGGCNRYSFAKGYMLLLFLARTEAGLIPMTDTFARVAEDVSTPDALWAKAVRIYIEIVALPLAERKAALRLRRDQLAKQVDDADAQAIAADIDRQLRAPEERWDDIIKRAAQQVNEPL